MGGLVLVLYWAVALQPLEALASPTPSPALSGLLAPPPSADYVEARPSVPGVFEGPFDAKGYIANSESSGKADQIQRTLERDGFIDGYGRTWVQKGSGKVLIEYVIAFSGGDGAKRWLTVSQVEDKADSNYKRSLSLTGIDTYYGGHYFYSSSQVYGDGFAFVKGNDFFALIFLSSKDDLGSAAADQTKLQFDSAPAYTIPPSEWPHSSSTANEAGASAGRLLLYGLIGAVLAVVGFVIRSRRRTAISAALPPVPALSFQLSPDGKFWWDGQAWKDLEHEVPPTAQRSADGTLWWDGRTWRPVPQPPI